MVEKPRLSIRSLARQLDLSRTTVSDALRGSARVNGATRQRVRETAHRLGYRYNPLAGALMTEMRRSALGRFQGVIAVLDVCDLTRDGAANRFNAEVLKGIRERALQLRFKIDTFMVGKTGMSMPRFEAVARTRNIRGIVLLPSCSPLHPALWAPDDRVVVYTDYPGAVPQLHSVCCDHYRSLITALLNLRARGYRRPGLVIAKTMNARLDYRWEAAVRAFGHHHPGVDAVPPLCFDRLMRAEFLSWFRRFEVDVVIGHHTDLIGLMESCGAQVPATHGFMCLNHALVTRPCAGLDQQPWLIGARALEAVIAKMRAREGRAPKERMTATIPARWVDGPTLATRVAGSESAEALPLRSVPQE